MASGAKNVHESVIAPVDSAVTPMTRQNLLSEGYSPLIKVDCCVRKLGISTAMVTTSSAPPPVSTQKGACQPTFWPSHVSAGKPITPAAAGPSMSRATDLPRCARGNIPAVAGVTTAQNSACDAPVMPRDTSSCVNVSAVAPTRVPMVNRPSALTITQRRTNLVVRRVSGSVVIITATANTVAAMPISASSRPRSSAMGPSSPMTAISLETIRNAATVSAMRTTHARAVETGGAGSPVWPDSGTTLVSGMMIGSPETGAA